MQAPALEARLGRAGPLHRPCSATKQQRCRAMAVKGYSSFRGKKSLVNRAAVPVTHLQDRQDGFVGKEAVGRLLMT